MRFNPLAMMGNHPIAKILSIAKNGGDPTEAIQMAVQDHPQREQIQKIVSGKSDAELFRTAENMCRECGTTIDEVLGSFGIQR